MISRPHPFQYDLYTEPVRIIPRQELSLIKTVIFSMNLEAKPNKHFH
jgi:hypothetical protein